MANRLAGETSPYLRQHAGNPVDWYPWGDDAFSAARREDRPVLLSVGYSACHWCHVMAHESFEDPRIAALMNQLFINVKVDREERPDVDTVYMQAVQGLTGRGGWPMTVFLTPDGRPFFAGTYFPPEDRHGMPGFPRVLEAAANAYRERRDEVEASATRIRDALTPRLPPGSGTADESLLDGAVRTLVAQTDAERGGFGDAPKFPHPSALDLMLHRCTVAHDEHVLDAALLTLRAMGRGGLFDQVGGGFHRYSVDATWSVPHFEKMLYDNAQLAAVYLHAYQLTRDDEMRDICVRTLDYMERELLLPSQGFAASQDADSPGGEGAYFVWNPDQLREQLGDEDAAFAAAAFGVDSAGNFEHDTTVPWLALSTAELADRFSMDEAAARNRLQAVRSAMFDARSRRPAPARDDKVITSWNALTVKAFAEAGAVLRDERYALIARRSAQFLLETVLDDGVVLRTWMSGQARITGFLEDAAHLADALLTVYEASGEPRFFEAAMRLCQRITEQYRDDTGAYYDTSSMGEQLIVRPHTVDDNPVAAGQSIAANAFARLHGFTGDDRWRRRALEIITPLGSVIPRAPIGLASLGLALHRLLRMREIAISGDAHDAATRSLVEEAWHPLLASRVVAWGPVDGVPILAGRTLVDGRPAAYVCSDFTCERPVGAPAELAALLRTDRSPNPEPSG
jgi:uncharacterized protein YyaL (SSP411 family)